MKELIKEIAFAIGFVILIPLFMLYYLHIFSFLSIAQLLSLIPGSFGIILRRVWYNCTLAKCGKELTVDFLGGIRTPRTEIGNNVYIGINSFIGLADIGDDTMISGHVLMLSGGAQHGTKRLDIPMRMQEGEIKKIKIGKDCWIGAGARIFADVAEHSVVGAGSVVTKTFKPYDIIAGVPAKKIKSR